MTHSQAGSLRIEAYPSRSQIALRTPRLESRTQTKTMKANPATRES